LAPTGEDADGGGRQEQVAQPSPNENTPGGTVEVEDRDDGGRGGGGGGGNGDGTVNGVNDLAEGAISPLPTGAAAVATPPGQAESGTREELGDIGGNARGGGRGGVGIGGGGGGGDRQEAGRQPVRGEEGTIPVDDPGNSLLIGCQGRPAHSQKEGGAGRQEEGRAHPPERGDKHSQEDAEGGAVLPQYRLPPPDFWKSVEEGMLSSSELEGVLEGVTEEEAERFLREKGLVDTKGYVKP